MRSSLPDSIYLYLCKFLSMTYMPAVAALGPVLEDLKFAQPPLPQDFAENSDAFQVRLADA